MWRSRDESAPRRHGRCGDRVRCGVRADPEPVEDDQDDGTRPWPGHRGARGQAVVPVAKPFRHATPLRARAVSPARATIPAISSGLSDAPPTSAPSIEGSARNSPMLADVTLPPY